MPKAGRGRVLRKQAFAVFTADSDQDQIFCDLVVAVNKKAALELITKIRGTSGYLTTETDRPCVYTANDLCELTGRLILLTKKESDKNIRELEDDYGLRKTGRRKK